MKKVIQRIKNINKNKIMKICEVKDCKNETNDAVLWDGKDYHEICEVHHAEMPKDFEFKPKIKKYERVF